MKKEKENNIQIRIETKLAIVENVEVQEPQNSSKFDQCASCSTMEAREE